jgi:DNA-binding protein YbaB
MGMANLQKMAQQMQQEMLRIQTELDVTIDPSAVDPDDVEMLQDLVLAAVNEALRSSRELAEQKMSAVTGGLRLPGM